ncbi:MAG: aminotransferase class I/II-fold pyridoxal phosphate-dependent enzyme, partial [Clostridia bacterium]|nr:aminotransferase class I/II-fold pyridoxal phosphate-dependent enzyme [Clostridia bacterium]
SKSRSLAGARLGFAIANEEIIKDLEKIKYSTNPYSINRLSLLAGEAAMKSDYYYKENAQKIIEAREYTIEELKKLGFKVLPSCANFIFAKKTGLDGEYIYKKLRENAILVRHFTKEKIKDYNRITIGTMEQMQKFIEVIKSIL